MTSTTVSNTTADATYIRIGDIVQRDGKAGELYQNIIAANENCDSLDEILALEKELDELKATQSDYEYISDMEECIAEAKENAEQYAEYKAIKAEALASTGDEDIADDIAWHLVYSKS